MKRPNLSENDSLTTLQRRSIGSLLGCSTIGGAAAAVGVSERTLRRWLNNPDFRSELNQAETSLLCDVLRVSVSDLRVNFETIREIRDNPGNPAGIRLRAALGLDGSILRWRELETIEKRLAGLEAAVYGDQNKTD